jgi:HK97 gp10 family phage protein
LADIEIVTDIQGLDELEATLTEGSRKAALKFLRNAEKKAARPVLDAQRMTVPIDYGDLLEALKISSSTRGDTLTVRVGPDKSQNYIGRFTEFGTIDQPAQHWMSRAFDASKESALDAFIEVATDSLEEMAE